VAVLVPVGCADPVRSSPKNSVPGNRRNCLREAPSGGNSARGTELLVDPNSGARCAIRDTGRTGAERYYWTVTAFDDHQAAAGRIGELAAARSQAEAALAAYVRAQGHLSGMRAGMSEELTRRFWEALFRPAYVVTDQRLRL
jgi:hypothetical protein